MSNKVEIIVSEEKDGSLIAQWNEDDSCVWILASDTLTDYQLDAFKKVNLVLDNPSIILRLVMWAEWHLVTLQYKISDFFSKNKE